MKYISYTFPNAVNLFGIVFGFISVLSGSTIGFIVSQPWYLIYNVILKRSFFLNRRSHYIRLIEIVGDRSSSELLSMMNYILTYMIDERITIYLNRLNDMVNSLLSTISAIWMVFIMDYCLRMFTSIEIDVISDTLFTRILCLFIIIILIINSYIVWLEANRMARLMINLNEWKIRRIFL